MTDWKHEIVPCGAYQEWRCQHPEYGILIGWHRAEPPTYHWNATTVSTALTPVAVVSPKAYKQQWMRLSPCSQPCRAMPTP